MRTYLHLLTAACLGTSALFTALPATADTVVKETVKTQTVKTDMKMDSAVVLPAGIAAKDLNADKSIEKAFKGVSEYGMSRTGFDNIVGYLVDQDRDRIKKSTDKTLNNLDGNSNKQLSDLIGSFENTWKTKYGKKFDIDYAKVFTSDFLSIQTGEVSDANQLVGKWPLPAMMMGTTAGSLSPSDASQAKDKAFGGDVNLEKGRNVAIAHMKASHGMPGITASLIYEKLSGWHFDIPNNTDANTLYSNLVNNLSYLDSHKNMLPDNVDDGYRAFSHAVVSSLYGVDLNKMPAKTAGER